MNYQGLLLNPNGRIGQREFWIGVLIIIAGNLVAGFVPLVGLLLSLALIYVGVCVYGKRLHDAGRSAWWHALPWAITLVLAIRGVIAAVTTVWNIDLAAATDGLESDAGLVDVLRLVDLSDLFAMGLAALGWLVLGWVAWLIYTLWVGWAVSVPEDNAHGSASLNRTADDDSATRA
jgi:uncharacterized membrane protein YhaH (DUF805 family)